MNNRHLSCIYYPTTTLIVDDNESFLARIQQEINAYTPSLCYSDPQEALKSIKQEIKRSDTLRHVMEVDTESEHYSHLSSQLPVQYNIENLYKQAYNRNLFSEISVVVVDYEMPNMKGEAVCEELKNSSIKIIMLTAEADDGMAVKLFNAGLIHKFIPKGHPNLGEILKTSISEMQKRYFQDLSYPILKGLVMNEDSSLGDPAFIDLFDQVCRDLSASSYYLIELSGSFLFLDDAGAPTWLIIKTQDELEEMSTQLMETDDLLPRLESMKKGGLIPYFSNLSDYCNPEKLFLEKHWYKASSLKGKKDYSYAIVKELKDFPLDTNKVFSLNAYMNQVRQITVG